MPSIARYSLRQANRIARFVLPRQVHYRLVIAAKSAIVGYRDAVRAQPVAGDQPPSSTMNTTILQIAEPTVVHGETSAPLPAESASVIVARVPAEEPIHRDALAEPLEPFVGCDGSRIEAGLYFTDRLASSGGECRLVLCCAFTGRHRIIEKIVRESLSANYGADVRWMLAGSSTEDLALIETLSRTTGRVAGFIVENRPLGRKWQTCLHFATKYFRAELYGITGSDDFVSSRLIDHIVNRHESNSKLGEGSAYLPAMYGTLEWLVCNTNPNSNHAPQIFKCSYEYRTAFEPLGAGRFYTREFLEECGGLIFDSDKERLLDDRGYFELRDRGYPLEYYTLEEGPLISVKGNWSQMNAIELFVDAPTLNVEEYSYRGYALLANSLSMSSQRYLFKPVPLSPQYTFSEPRTGLGANVAGAEIVEPQLVACPTAGSSG